ncbi:uncharacterized protein LOC111400348 [Olea europaea var. sylvestris]|uniref:uncharacterized protein LOC111400348 n=1 Tax=Olea europaea var. sylvestris TaxID=158386 RepID=UPI000C1D14E7|nr:uncharacterized protein LOC111400348 [Olea europaea var. sylvestris]
MNKMWIAVSAIVVAFLAITSFSPLEKFYHNFAVPQSFLHGVVADLLVTNGTIYTSNVNLPFADSMAVRNGRILRIGNYSSMQDLAGFATKTLNLEGKVVVPGFIDSHVHLIFGGLQMAQVQLRGVDRREHFVNKVKEALSNMRQGSWLLGGGWNNDLWGGELPMASWIDDISPYNPVWLTRMDGHMGLANSMALKIAGISKSTEDPGGGAVMRNGGGEPTGLLVDSAMKLVLSCIPEVSIKEKREALLRASNHALMRGVTTVVDFGRYFPGVSTELSWEDLSDVYRWADLSGNMKIRVCLFFPIETWARLYELINEAGRKLSQWIYLGGMKSFADGSLGSSSALLYEPYVDEVQNYGLQVADMDGLYNMTVSSDKSGLQIAVHAIGDRANDLILDMFKFVASKNGIRDRRFRVNSTALSLRSSSIDSQVSLCLTYSGTFFLPNKFSEVLLGIYGCMPLNFLGLGAGGGCGVGLGLGWGFGTAFGSQYRNSRVTFEGTGFDRKNHNEERDSENPRKKVQKIHASQ